MLRDLWTSRSTFNSIESLEAGLYSSGPVSVLRHFFHYLRLVSDSSGLDYRLSAETRELVQYCHFSAPNFSLTTLLLHSLPWLLVAARI